MHHAPQHAMSPFPKNLSSPLIAAALAISSSASLAASPANTDLEVLRKQIDALRGDVEKLQQQLHQQRLTQPYAAVPGRSQTIEPATARSSDPQLQTSGWRQGGPSLAPKGGISPNISVAIDAVGSYSQKQDNVRLTPRDAELMFQANIDPFARAYLITNAGSELDPTGKQGAFDQVTFGLEEAAIETTALPFGLQLKAGQFFADFTRLGKFHPHDLPFVDHPPVLEQLLGGETKGRGVELNWVPPVPYYIKLTLGAVDNVGAERSALGGFNLDRESTRVFQTPETRGFGSLTYYWRGASVIELGESVFLHMGTNVLHGRDEGTRTVWGADAKLVWRLSGNNEAEIGGEFLSGRQSGALTHPLHGADTGGARGKGGYVYAQYRIGKTWTPGVRFDFVRTHTLAEADSTGGTTTDSLETSDETLRAVSGYLGYQISEYQRLRLQLTYANSNQAISGDSKHDLQAFLQWTILLGSHQHALTP